MGQQDAALQQPQQEQQRRQQQQQQQQQHQQQQQPAPSMTVPDGDLGQMVAMEKELAASGASSCAGDVVVVGKGDTKQPVDNPAAGVGVCEGRPPGATGGSPPGKETQQVSIATVLTPIRTVQTSVLC